MIIGVPKEIKDNEARPFIGVNIGENIKGDSFGLTGYEFTVTGGSDYCGFPMRRGILGQRKKITILRGFDAGACRALRNAERLLATEAWDAEVPGSDGERAGRMAAAARAHIALLAGDDAP